MRIAVDTLFEHPDSPSSAIDYLRVVADLLPKIGGDHEFFLLVSPRNRKHFEAIRHPNLSLLDCRVSNERVGRRIAAQQTLVPWRLRQQAIDVLYAPGNVCPLVTGVPVVLKINTLHHEQDRQSVGLMRQAYRRYAFKLSARAAKVVCANTELTKEQIVRFMGIPAEKVDVIPESATEAFGAVDASRQRAVCSRYGLTAGYILFASAFYSYKNPETLVRAYARLVSDDRTNRSLVFIGRDIDGRVAALQAMAKDLGVGERLRFLGFLPAEDLPPLFSAARVFVFPSFIETFGKPLVEAMASGVPVVASNTSCIPEVLGGAGLLVDPSSDSEMAEAIHLAAEDVETRRGMIERGLRRAADFSWRAHCTRLVEIFESVGLVGRQDGDGTVSSRTRNASPPGAA